MARIRSVKPEFWGDRKMARLSRDARLLYVALWNQADEHSRMQGDPRYVKGHCLPYDDDLDLDAIEALIDELVGAGRVIRYHVDGDPFLFLPKLAAHQRLEPAKVASRLPEPPDSSVVASVPAPVSDPDPDLGADTDANLTARRADSSEKKVALQVACSRLPVAGSMEPVAPKNESARKRDEIWDTLLEVCGIDPDIPPTSSARKAYNAAVKQLRDIGATPPDIRRRAAIYRGQWPGVSLSPNALARRWAECERQPSRAGPTPSRNNQILNANMRDAIDHDEATQPRKALP